MCQYGFPVLNHIDDFLGYCFQSAAKHSYDALYDAMNELTPTMFKIKLVAINTQAAYLGILENIVHATLSIPDEKVDLKSIDHP